MLWPNDPGWWIAETYRYQDRVLTVRVKMGPEAANTTGMRLCLWTGGVDRKDRYVLGCVAVDLP